ncbi:MAG: hypothetical protein RL196_1529 [Actinomycetota bacterium]
MAKKDGTNVPTNRHVKLSPIYQVVLPGFLQIKSKRKAFGVIALSIWASIFALIGVVAFIYTNDLVLFFTILTSDKYLLAIEVFIGLVGFTLVAVAFDSIVRVLRSSIKVWVKPIIAILLAAAMSGQTAVAYTGTQYVQSQRDMLNSIFTSQTNDSTASNQLEGLPVATLAMSHEGAALSSANATILEGLGSGFGSPISLASSSSSRVNILLIGGDAGGGRIGLRADSISVLSVNKVTGKTVIIGLPRNMQRVPFVKGSPMQKVFPNGFNCGSTCLLNAIYTYANGHRNLYSAKKYKGKNPGFEATREAVEGVLGIKIPYMLTSDMGFFATLVFAVGGLRVCVPKRTLGEDMKTVFHKGCQTMNGSRAILYARTRYDWDDYHRMLKQRLLQEALIKQVTPQDLIFNWKKVAKAASHYVTADIPRDQLGSLLALGMRARTQSLTTLEITPPKFNMVYPDFAAIRKSVKSTLGKN